MQDRGVRPIAMAAGLRKVIRSLKRSKVREHVGTAIPAFVFGPEPGCILTSVLRASVRDLPCPARAHPHARLLIYVSDESFYRTEKRFGCGLGFQG